MGSASPSPPLNPFKDCSQEICSVYCPQWCYLLFPPPPPLFAIDDSGTYFSPLIVAVIGILASAFILLTYYAIVSRYCRRRSHPDSPIVSGQSFETDSHQPGLDEALINSISVYNFKKAEGLVDGTDCSVCLSEFQENESLRLLPKCTHAFHLACIDTWLKSNSTCPLCRSTIAFTDHPPPIETARGYRRGRGGGVLMVEDLPETVVVEIVIDASPERVDGGDEEDVRPFERTDLDSDLEESSAQRGNLSVADVLSVGHEEDGEIEIGDEKEDGKSRNRSGGLDSAAKKPRSSGIFTFGRKGRSTNSSN